MKQCEICRAELKGDWSICPLCRQGKFETETEEAHSSPFPEVPLKFNRAKVTRVLTTVSLATILAYFIFQWFWTFQYFVVEYVLFGIMSMWMVVLIIINESRAEDDTIKFLEQYIHKSQSPLCGNTICQDRRFLARCMPKLESFCHYRNIDVSSIRELGKRWYFEDIDNFQKNSNHRALDDIRDSIEELRYYRKKIFKL